MTVQLKKEALHDLIKIKEEFDSIVESLELMSDEKFMASYKEARKQVAKREFEDWNEL